jgi:hypothetical protein
VKFHIWCTGDSSVGIPGAACVLDWPELEENSSDKERTEYIKFVKDTLQTTFKDIFDDRHTTVMTDKEFEEYTKVEE